MLNRMCRDRVDLRSSKWEIRQRMALVNSNRSDESREDINLTLGMSRSTKKSQTCVVCIILLMKLYDSVRTRREDTWYGSSEWCHPPLSS